MKAHLMHADADFQLDGPEPWNAPDLVQDLELEILLRAMSGEDEFLYKVARAALLSGCATPEAVLYRQAVLRDCIRNPEAVASLYAVTTEALEVGKKAYWGLSHFVAAILGRSREVLLLYVGVLGKLRTLADSYAETFASPGFSAFFSMLRRELGEDYFAEVQAHLDTLRFRHGVLISARLGRGNKGEDYVLRRPAAPEGSWLRRVFRRKPVSFRYQLPPRDEAGSQALSELRGRGINQVANALAQSTEHILGFMTALRTELAFYVACLNLHARLAGMDAPVVFPSPAPAHASVRACQGLYDICLALHMGRQVVGNDLPADGKSLCVITGANQGGKSTFLRAVGVAQLMMQCGMFVPAESWAGRLSTSVLTHYKREEDAALKSGKLDEELARMSRMVEHLEPGALVLFNESFAATNAREGAGIAREITLALLEHGIEVFFVTHLHDFARALYEDRRADAIYLRARREDDGTRPFTLEQAPPQAGSHGEDLYRRVFGVEDVRPDEEAAPPAASEAGDGH